VIALNKKKLKKNLLLTLIDEPLSVDLYNILRTQILHRTREKGHNTIMITSALEGEGKTTTAINLAVSIAKEEKQTVLLVDADLRNPMVSKLLGFQSELGLSDYLQRDVRLENILFNPGIANMVVLPGGRPLPNSTDLIGSTKMEVLVSEMKHRYPNRYIIFDCPPVLSLSDALIFSSYVDGAILVVEAGKTSRNQIQSALDLLSDKNIIGLVMNKGEFPNTYYYY